MLINALNSYYDVLVDAGAMVPENYSKVDVDYMIFLTEEGKIASVQCLRSEKQIPQKNGKIRKAKERKSVILPKRTQKTSIDANFLEHRPLYLFGLEYDGKTGTLQYKEGGKADKSHKALRKAAEEWFSDMNSPAARAYYNFAVNWEPARETENPYLKNLGSDYEKSRYVFCLEGDIMHPLSENTEVRSAWEALCRKKEEDQKDVVLGQCGITGQKDVPIARIHQKITGLMPAGGNSTGCVLVGYKEKAFQSYGNQYSYNSNISEQVMQRYTASMNYLLKSPVNHMNLDQTMVMYWSQDGNAEADAIISQLYGVESPLTRGAADEMFTDLMKKTAEGKLTFDAIRESMSGLNPEADYYFVGMKPNGPRIAIRFAYCRKYGTVLQNAGQHQLDLQVMPGDKPVELWRMKKELVSPKSSSEKVTSTLVEGILQSMILGTEYPSGLIQKVLYRMRADRFDTDAKDSSADGADRKTEPQPGYGYGGSRMHDRIRVGVLKACLCRHERKQGKEDIKVGLNRDSTSQAYLCGRLFAVIQKLQEEASGRTKLNRTIRDAYFASASVKPAGIFPELLRLAQIYMKKVNDLETAYHSSVYYEKLIEEILGKMNNAFPQTLSLYDQGRFMIGYYQQYQDFFAKKEEV